MGCSSGWHTTFLHRYQLVSVPKYRFKVLHDKVRLRVHDIIRQFCGEMGVILVHGVLSRDHVHMSVEIPPHVSVSNFLRRPRGGHGEKSSRSLIIFTSDIRANASGSSGTSPPRPATSLMISSCVASTSMTIIMASAPYRDPASVSRSVR